MKEMGIFRKGTFFSAVFISEEGGKVISYQFIVLRIISFRSEGFSFVVRSCKLRTGN